MAETASPPGTESAGWAAEVYRALAEAGVRQVGYVPDGPLTPIIDLCAADRRMRSVPLTSEEEGAGLLAGAWLGGQRGVLLMQSSGVGNCINALSLIRACRFPFLAVVTMRGEWAEFNPWQVPMGRSCRAHLEAAGVAVHRIERAEAAGPTVRGAAALAFDTSSPVAVLVAQSLVGAKSFDE